jgi:septal ring factor EnvC (AmiA/AmiB activator)
MKTMQRRTNRSTRHVRHLGRIALLAAALAMLAAAARSSADDPAPAPSAPASPPPTSLEDTRLKMGKWIETQQIISQERNDWQQGKEILAGRIELIEREVAALEEKIKQAEASVAESGAKRDALTAERDGLQATAAGLAQAVAAMESEVRKLFPSLPKPIVEKLKPLHDRMPEATAEVKVSVAERFQNVLGILNELNKAGTDITVSYEVRDLANGKPSEVQVLYIGLAQAYYVSPSGDAGVGRPSPQGWTWTPAPTIAPNVLTALEILQGKHSPAFVPLPVEIQ